MKLDYAPQPRATELCLSSKFLRQSLETPSFLSQNLRQSSFLSTGMETPCSLPLSLEPSSLSIPAWSRKTLCSLKSLSSLQPEATERHLSLKLQSCGHLSLEPPSSLCPSQRPPNHLCLSLWSH